MVAGLCARPEHRVHPWRDACIWSSWMEQTFNVNACDFRWFEECSLDARTYTAFVQAVCCERKARRKGRDGLGLETVSCDKVFRLFAFVYVCVI